MIGATSCLNSASSLLTDTLRRRRVHHQAGSQRRHLFHHQQRKGERKRRRAATFHLHHHHQAGQLGARRARTNPSVKQIACNLGEVGYFNGSRWRGRGEGGGTKTQSLSSLSSLVAAVVEAMKENGAPFISPPSLSAVSAAERL